MTRLPTVPTTIGEMLLPSSTALIVWDWQEGIAGRAQGLPALRESVASLLEGARRSDVPVIWSRHTNLPLEFAGPARLRDLMRRQGVSTVHELTVPMRDESDAAGWLDGFAPVAGELVLPKTTSSFFIGTPLETCLRSQSITSIVLAGVATESGIEFTARHAAALGYLVVVAEDAVGSANQRQRENALEYLRTVMPVVPVTEILRHWT